MGNTENTTRLIVRIVVSLSLLAAGLFVLIARPDSSPELEKAAFTWIGLTVGYWMR